MIRKMIFLIFGLILVISLTVIPANAATEAEIDQAIQDGLEWLANQQNSNGSFGSGANPVAYTAAAVLAFEDEGYFPGPDSSIPSAPGTYARRVEDGLDFIFNYAHQISISVQPAGDPEINDNDDLGVHFYDEGLTRSVYETGLVMLAIVASNTPNRVVTIGVCAGQTYYDVMVDLVDWAAFGQVDSGTGRGGWRYYANYENSDNSTAQWPVLGLIAAGQWGIMAPQFVKNELNIWIDYIQDDASGGSGYSNPTEYLNVSKTGALLLEMYYVGDDKDTLRAQAATNFINSRWNNAPSDVWYGNKGHGYAMFSVFKGLELMEIATIPNAPPNDETSAGDWWGDYCEYLVNTQNPDGSWTGYSNWNNWLSTAWYICILQATIFPVDVDVDLPDCSCDVDGYDIEVTYKAERFEVDGTLKIYKNNVLEVTVILDDFQGEETYIINVSSDTPGTHEWRAELDVTNQEGAPAYAEKTKSIDICETPQVGDIPDQDAPFETFDLDDYITYGGGLPVTWTATTPLGWTVNIDADNVVTVTAPIDAIEPETITFTASVECCTGIICSDSDDAVFTPFVAFITGGGTIKENKQVKWTFAGNVGFLADGEHTLTGQYQIRDHENKESWHCHNNFESLEFAGVPTTSPPARKNQGTFVGHFTSNKGGETILTIVITDNDESGKKGDIINVSGGLNFVGDPISSGNLQIHEGLK